MRSTVEPMSATLAAACLILMLGTCYSPGGHAQTSATRGAPWHASPAFHETASSQRCRATGWLTNGGNLANQRYSPLTEINRDNVANLRGVWRASLGGSGMGPRSANQAQPIVHEGVVYIVTGDNDAFAIDIDTGNVLWEYEAHVDPNVARPCCGWAARGVGLGDGKIFVGQLDAKLVALDQRTGKVVWSIQAEDPKVGFSITSAPLYYDGKVITGFAGGDLGTRGRVKAFDAKTGELEWTFYTVPGPGEIGHETWPQDSDVWKYGGASVWQTPAIDPELGLIYFSTSNPGPVLNGNLREGDNLFSVSIVAIDARSGEYRWHFQQVHHDIWDYDSPNPIILFDAPYNGTLRKGLAQAAKTGWVYLLDRATGEPLIGIVETPVMQEPQQRTAATQPFPIGDAIVPQSIDIPLEGYELVNDGKIFTPFKDDKPVLWKPLAAVNWPPSSYDPDHLHDVHLRDGFTLGRRRRRPRVSRRARRAVFRQHRGAGVGAAARHLRGARRAHESARVAPAMDRHLLLGLDHDGRRPRVRRPQRRPHHRARQQQRQTALGVPNGRRRQCAGLDVRARRQAVRRRLRGRHEPRRQQALRRRLAVRARRHVAIAAARLGRPQHARHDGAARRGARRARG